MSLTSIEFRCPRCKGLTWGTSAGKGVCHSGTCKFTWSRAHDFRVFVYKDTGEAIGSAAELEAVSFTPRPRLPTVPELLHDLLCEVMERPPTAGIIELWTRAEQRAAVEWLAREILDSVDDGARGTYRTPRPRFIEEGAATA